MTADADPATAAHFIHYVANQGVSTELYSAGYVLDPDGHVLAFAQQIVESGAAYR